MASASRSRTRWAIGDRTDAGFVGGRLSDEPDADIDEGRGEAIVNELEWLNDGELCGGGSLEDELADDSG